MPRRSKLLVLEHTDGTFRVAVFAQRHRPDYRVKSGYRGHRPAETTAPSRQEAEMTAAAIWDAYQRGLIDAPVAPCETVGELDDRIEARTDISPATRAGYRKAWRLLTQHVGEGRPLSRLYPLDVASWLAQYPETNATRASLRRQVCAIASWARRQGWIPRDICEGVTASEPERQPVWLPVSSWARFLAACGPSHRIRCGLVLETGLRLGEVMHARPSWVIGDVGRPSIRVQPDAETGWLPKRGKSRSVPLTRSGQRWVREAQRMWKGPWLLSANGISSGSNLARDTRRACAKAKVGPVTFHDLRRSAAVRWLEAGTGIVEIQHLLGHRSVTTTERYLGVSLVNLTRAIDRVDRARADNVVPLRRRGEKG